ncbi:MAG: chaperone modulator CbpM [Pseudomonadota bacterium]|jgi:MerR family transcriptional regulator/heat shock protein HspR
MKGDKTIHEIAEICRRLGIQPVELEAMEEEGLITLAALRDGKALPSEQLDRLNMIIRLQRDLGINLAGIDVILDMRSKMFQMRREVDDILDFIRRRISEDLREMLGEEEYPLALGEGEKFLVIERGTSRRADPEKG